MNINWQAVRDGLAMELMGWFQGFGNAYYRTTDNELVYAYHEWHPDTDLSQCGMVIEAMQGAGWRMSIYMGGTVGPARGETGAMFERGMALTGSCGHAKCDTFPRAICLAAARALGIEGIEEGER